MSLASDMLAASFSLVTGNPSIAGELVTFRGETVSVSILRGSGDGLEPASMKTSTKDQATVQFPLIIDPAPARGQTLTTAYGESMRLERVVRLQHCYEATCAVLR